ncbi:short chain dehydrogenase reductase [Sporothrix brasiliensis 5110]|uniref:Short chain dehydrogenase reductase n=1 Tax=Sporothrix brasiliensis 5110 TaxID=1398154 RepID=A0A0C2IUG4_9PEZI|nr:short chain dehydrogenase reductase [Sporothrix brasiliensis 5110]KIH90405.1 short chain dehydrogenase reductase [Sporothrix brasiliensis 5110]
MASKTVALITGANQGIGFEIARRLATEQKDYVVVMAGRRKDAIEEAAKKLQADGLTVEPIVLDVDSDESIEAAAQEVEQKHGRLDVLINNAGISNYTDPKLAKASSAVKTRSEWAAIMNTNVSGVAAVTDAFLPLMKKSIETNKPKRIVFMSSTLGSMGYKSDPKAQTHANVARAYTTSKAALNMLAWHYMVDLEGDTTNWKINCNCPGYCATNLNGYAGYDTVENGSINAVRLATLGPDGETATYTNRQGVIPW